MAFGQVIKRMPIREIRGFLDRWRLHQATLPQDSRCSLWCYRRGYVALWGTSSPSNRESKRHCGAAPLASVNRGAMAFISQVHKLLGLEATETFGIGSPRILKTLKARAAERWHQRRVAGPGGNSLAQGQPMLSLRDSPVLLGPFFQALTLLAIQYHGSTVLGDGRRIEASATSTPHKRRFLL
jgi:hypothetical protein